LRHPVYKTGVQEFALALTGEHLKNETFLLGEGFSFAPGAERGKSDITALRFSQEWTYQSEKQVFAIRSRFSLGIDILDATIHDSGLPDGEFFSWLGQFQWARRMGFWDSQLIFKTDIQISGESLLPLEQIAVGGRYSVRGYRENLLVRDNGLIASVEFRIPVVRDKPWADSVQLAPFFDFGRAWNEDTPTPYPKNISSVGLGLRWELTLKKPARLKPRVEIYWGESLRDVDKGSEYDLQDDGIHFQFVLEF
jgi:hemolysin activation/secretion protein